MLFFAAVLSVAWTQAAAPGDELFPAGAPYLSQPPAYGQIPSAAPCCSTLSYGRPYGVHWRAGYAACGCPGSYKYPVPPQSTYWWPGIYSQQTLTAYVSPWRYPPLLMPDVMAGASDPQNELPATHPATPAKKDAQAKPAR